MTITQTNYDPRDRMNSRMTRHVTLTGGDNVAAGGETVNPTNDFGLAEIHSLHGIVRNGAGAIRILYWDRANSKIQYFVPNTGAEATGDLSAFSGDIIAFGR